MPESPTEARSWPSSSSSAGFSETESRDSTCIAETLLPTRPRSGPVDIRDRRRVPGRDPAMTARSIGASRRLPAGPERVHRARCDPPRTRPRRPARARSPAPCSGPATRAPGSPPRAARPPPMPNRWISPEAVDEVPAPPDEVIVTPRATSPVQARARCWSSGGRRLSPIENPKSRPAPSTRSRSCRRASAPRPGPSRSPSRPGRRSQPVARHCRRSRTGGGPRTRRGRTHRSRRAAPPTPRAWPCRRGSAVTADVVDGGSARRSRPPCASRPGAIGHVPAAQRPRAASDDRCALPDARCGPGPRTPRSRCPRARRR